MTIAETISLIIASLAGLMQLINSLQPKLVFKRTNRVNFNTDSDSKPIATVSLSLVNRSIFRSISKITMLVDFPISEIVSEPAIKGERGIDDNLQKEKSYYFYDLGVGEIVTITIISFNPPDNSNFKITLRTKRGKAPEIKNNLFPVSPLWLNIGMRLISLIGLYYLVILIVKIFTYLNLLFS